MQDKSFHRAAPRTCLLSNGNYSVMVTAAGSGFSRWRDVAVTRWRDDATCDSWGSYVFLRDLESGQVWTAGQQPMGRDGDAYEATFSESRAELVHKNGALLTTTEIIVAPEDDAEVRRISLTNQGGQVREIELTTYAELVLLPPDADAAHPAFAKMFVQTEFVPEAGALLATRRRREPAEHALWAAHVSVVDDAAAELHYESDRARFLGRGNDLRNAASVFDGRPLSNTTGTVLDPIFALRRRVRVAAGATVRITFWTLVAETRAQVLALIGKCRDSSFDRVQTAAQERARQQLQDLGMESSESEQIQRIADRVLYTDASLRTSPRTLARNQSGPAALWAFAVSGDLPIVLLHIGDQSELALVTAMLRAHRCWRRKWLPVDLIVLNGDSSSDSAALQTAIEAAVKAAASREDEFGSRRGSVFVLRGDAMTESARDVLDTAARAILTGGRALSEQLAGPREPDTAPRIVPPAPPGAAPPGEPSGSGTPQALEFFNGLGGFAAAGREFVTVLDGGEQTPAPWINVVANPHFGFQVSAGGAGTTWSLNARENQLTPWSNDPVCDPPSEVIYVRDEESGELWSATPQPIRQPHGSYVVHHGFGYSRFEHTSHGIGLDLLQFVPLNESVKISRLKIANVSSATRRLSFTHYADLVLGNQRSRTAPFIVTEVDAKTSALLIRNPWRTEFQSRVVFLDAKGAQKSCSGDRAEFIGRHGSLSEPAALLRRTPLSNRVGGGLDSCGATQTPLTLQAGEEAELVFFLGEAESKDAAVSLIERYRGLNLDDVFKSVTDYWESTLGTVQVKTPDRSLDILLNGWLLYQTLVCRLWARTGFYQSSGAYGFRDQLQDVMALCVSRPALAREHILRAAARQFMAGDVQHWWLPTSGQGVKTRISDNRIWLPFVVSHYLEVTADAGILDEQVPFLEGPPLQPDQHEIFNSPATTAATASLFEHCRLALDSSLAVGARGLPLFGAGDWNDGMNRVGAQGRGESVWLGWFLRATLLKFAVVADRHGSTLKSAAWRQHAAALLQAIESEAWDGNWYRRGYFDDGTPLGSTTNDECRIDAIAQSWAVIAGGGDLERAAHAMTAVDAQLVSRSDRLVKLFTPPFSHSPHDPGYIQAYPAGLRENGGQYTHAATWTALAFVLMGNGDRAGELFSLLNPINHASTREGLERYKVEPYVICADVYSAASHVGRGGWTWYTGSAGWMYRAAIEGMLGFNVQGDSVSLKPCIPRGWPGFDIAYRHGSSTYHIAISNPNGVCRGIAHVSLDDRDITHAGGEIALTDDGYEHYARVVLG